MAKSSKSKQAEQERARKKREREYRRRLKLLEKTGVYQPKGEELTRYRKMRINKAFEQWQPFLEDTRRQFMFVDASKTLTKKELKKFHENADSLQMKTTKTGVFIGREGQRRARIVRPKSRPDEFDIELSGKVKWGINKGKRIKDRIPVAPLDRLGDERQRLEHMAKDAGPLKSGEALSFVVVQNGSETGAHKSTYDTVEGVMRALNGYHKDNYAHRLAFFRLVQIRKTTLTEWRKEHPPKSKKRMTRAQRARVGYNPH